MEHEQHQSSQEQATSFAKYTPQNSGTNNINKQCKLMLATMLACAKLDPCKAEEIIKMQTGTGKTIRHLSRTCMYMYIYIYMYMYLSIGLMQTEMGDCHGNLT